MLYSLSRHRDFISLLSLLLHFIFCRLKATDCVHVIIDSELVGSLIIVTLFYESIQCKQLEIVVYYDLLV